MKAFAVALIKRTQQTGEPMIFNREPALILGLVAAVISVATAFGLDWTAEQVGLVNAAVAAVVALLVRSKVTPVD